MTANRGRFSQEGGRRIRNDMRSRHERLMTAVVRWGRAIGAQRSANGSWDETMASELQAAEDALYQVYRELPSEV